MRGPSAWYIATKAGATLCLLALTTNAPGALLGGAEHVVHVEGGAGAMQVAGTGGDVPALAMVAGAIATIRGDAVIVAAADDHAGLMRVRGDDEVLHAAWIVQARGAVGVGHHACRAAIAIQVASLHVGIVGAGIARIGDDAPDQVQIRRVHGAQRRVRPVVPGHASIVRVGHIRRASAPGVW
jgi:hypothetical protein